MEVEVEGDEGAAVVVCAVQERERSVQLAICLSQAFLTYSSTVVLHNQSYSHFQLPILFDLTRFTRDQVRKLLAAH